MPETKKITLEFNEGAPSPEQLKALETFAKSIGATFQVASGAEDSKPAQTAPSIEVPKLPNGEPALWANRTTGREVSPIEFIRAHYGRTNSDGSWDNQGLTRKWLAQLDPPLANAYKQAISRNPERALPGLPPQEVVHIDDPVKALERRKEQQRAASARYRSKL